MTMAVDTASDVLRRNPITGIATSCARAASGHIAAAPPTNAMNSRRFIRSNCICSPSQGLQASILHWRASSQGLAAVRDFGLPDVRVGSNFVIAAMSAARPLFHRKRKSIGGLSLSHKCYETAYVRQQYYFSFLT